MSLPAWELAAGASLLASGLVACWMDIRHRLLPNWLVLVTAAAAAGTAAWGGFLGVAAIHMALALVIGMALFALKVVGAGDAKYYAALALFFPWQGAAIFALCIGLGGIVLLAGTTARLALPGRNPPARAPVGTRMHLPFGVALAIGAMLAWTLPRWGSLAAL